MRTSLGRVLRTALAALCPTLLLMGLRTSTGSTAPTGRPPSGQRANEERLARQHAVAYLRILRLERAYDRYLSKKERAASREELTERLDLLARLEPPDEEIGRALDEIERAHRSDLEESARRRARLRLRIGLVVTFAVSALAIAASAWLIPHVARFYSVGAIAPLRQLHIRDVFLCLCGSILGSSASVLLRTRGNAIIDHRTAGFWAAVAQVMVGWLFAVALLALIKGKILTIFNDPTVTPVAVTLIGDVISSGFFWTGLGILVGFNERWAGNLLRRGPEEKPDDEKSAPSTADDATTGATTPSDVSPPSTTSRIWRHSG